MKKLLIAFIIVTPLWCMESGTPGDKTVTTYNQLFAPQRLRLVDLVESSPRERPFGSLDPMDLALCAAVDPKFHEDDAMTDAVALHNQE